MPAGTNGLHGWTVTISAFRTGANGSFAHRSRRGQILWEDLQRSLPKIYQTVKQAGLYRRNPFNHPTVMFRKSAVLTAGSYRDCACFEDYDLWTRMLGCGAKGYNIQKTLVYMRAGDGMYARRGGLRYALRGVNARWRIYRGGYCGLWDFFVSSGGQVLVSLIPVKCRSGFYRRFLRR